MNYRNKDRTKNKYGIKYKLPKGAEYGKELSIRKITHWHTTLRDLRASKLFSKRLQRDIADIPAPTFPDIDFWDGGGFFSFGPAGVGKTVNAAQMLLNVQKHLWLNFQHRELLFTSVPKLFGRLKRTFNTEDQNQYDILDEQNNAWLLVLDDLGVSGKPSDWLLETLYLIINHRYENLLPTIITSNLDLNELSDLYGDVRITSRIDRMCTIAKKSHWDKGH